jgi:hypothetical protein
MIGMKYNSDLETLNCGWFVNVDGKSRFNSKDFVALCELIYILKSDCHEVFTWLHRFSPYYVDNLVQNGEHILTM